VVEFLWCLFICLQNLKNKFYDKTNTNKSKLIYYVYNGKLAQVDKNLTMLTSAKSHSSCILLVMTLVIDHLLRGFPSQVMTLKYDRQVCQR